MHKIITPVDDIDGIVVVDIDVDSLLDGLETHTERVAVWKSFFDTHGIYYYARPNDSFNRHEGIKLAKQNDFGLVYLENLS